LTAQLSRPSRIYIPALAGASTPSWHTHRISHAGDRGDRLNAITCRSSSLCVAVGDGGLVAVLRRGA
jgi:hypothetical protein